MFAEDRLYNRILRIAGQGIRSSNLLDPTKEETIAKRRPFFWRWACSRAGSIGRGQCAAGRAEAWHSHDRLPLRAEIVAPLQIRGAVAAVSVLIAAPCPVMAELPASQGSSALTPAEHGIA